MLIEWVPFVAVGIAALVAAAEVGSTSQLRVIRNLLVAGMLMRIIGVLARHTMIFELYDGGSDAVGYFETGRIVADHFRSLDFSIVGSGRWGDREWGTQAIRYASGFVLTFVGPSMRGAFLVFSLAAFIGLVCTAVAVGRANGSSAMRHAAALLFFWPTLWFWPSSIGKEAVLLLAVGLVTLGYVGRAERIHWLPMASGLALALAIRPHLAGILALSTCVAEWTSREWSVRRFAQSVLASAVAIWFLSSALGLLGLGSADLDTLQAFATHTAGQTNQGGSAFDGPGSTATAIPMAFLNILCRPFITEANSPMALISSLEMMAFWVLLIRNGRTLRSALRSLGTNRLLRFAILFVSLYVLMIGLTFQNFGIIARQRALVMPALLLMLAAVPAARTRRTPVIRPRKAWRTSTPPPSLVSIGRSS